MNEDWSDDISSESDLYYSDQIDSDVEAELYSLIHHDVTDNSIISLENEDPPQGNSVSPTTAVQPESNTVSSKSVSALSENERVNGNKSYIKCIKRNCNLNVDSFSSDVTMNSNLYTSFETPEKIYNMQRKQNERFRKATIAETVKRKSDEVSKVLEHIQVTLESNSRSISLRDNSLKQTINRTNLVKQSNVNSITRDEIISSDSESSVIFIESDDSDLQTNLTKDTVTLSSDCYESDSSTERMIERSCQVKGSSLPNTLNSDKKDPWHVNFDDAYRSRKFSNRYHQRAVLTCSNCNMKGHSVKFCSVPKTVKCFICGGNHTGIRCRDKVCSKCAQKGHDFRRCFTRIIDTCFLCKMNGHVIKNCPDLWRRYHLTTSLGKIIKGKQRTSDTPIFCYNCGLKGHYGAECQEYRMNNSQLHTWTSVICYKNPRGTYRNEKETYNPKENYQDKNTNVFYKKKQPMFTQTPPLKRNKKKKVKPVILPKQNNTNLVRNEVYFPRTPKATARASGDKASSENNLTDFLRSLTPSQLKKIKRKERQQRNRKKQIRAKQREHRKGLQQRLGVQPTES